MCAEGFVSLVERAWKVSKELAKALEVVLYCKASLIAARQERQGQGGQVCARFVNKTQPISVGVWRRGLKSLGLKTLMEQK